MADKKPKKSSFNVPSYGVIEKIPEGHVAKMDRNGVVHYVPVKKAKKTDKK